jgi:phosphatidylinositol 4-kinase
MLDDQGHVLHIDFGFIFDIAPGGLKFEMSTFKLSQEMIGLMGGGREAPAFREFTKLFAQCFIAARARYAELEAIAWLMRKAGFPCFKPASFQNFQQRFFLDKPESELITAIDDVIADAMGSVTTRLYDQFQYSQNQIFFV